jgi:hypothetical protein
VAGHLVEHLLAGVALIGVYQVDRLAGQLLHPLAEHADLGPVLLVGRRDVQRQKMPQRIDGHVDLRPPAPLVAVVSGARPALGRRLDGAAVDDRLTRVGDAALGQAEELAEFVYDGLEAAGGHPSPGLVVDGVPGGQVVGDEPPGRAGAHQPAEGVEDLAEIVPTLSGSRQR